MKRVVIGLSGGVDSSVAAIILKNQGYEVVGVTFLFNELDTDASKVAEKLGIEYHVLDYRENFKKIIIDNFISDYQKGLTPNPCVRCNKYVKMQYLYDAMIEFKCDYIATGHYAKIIDGKLCLSSDLNKDQTYFLSCVDQKIIDHLLLPLDSITKEEVRQIALDNNLEVATKKDSTDVCFIDDKFKDFLQTKVKSTPGDIIDLDSGKVLGTHDGLMYYTIGQRRGLSVGGTQNRLFVVGKNLEKNILYVSENEENLLSDSCLVLDINWYGKKVTSCQAKFRYHQPNNDVLLEFLDDNKVLVKFKNKIKSVTPGQIAVFYNDNICLGGGIIKEVYKEGNKLEIN